MHILFLERIQCLDSTWTSSISNYHGLKLNQFLLKIIQNITYYNQMEKSTSDALTSVAVIQVMPSLTMLYEQSANMKNGVSCAMIFSLEKQTNMTRQFQPRTNQQLQWRSWGTTMLSVFIFLMFFPQLCGKKLRKQQELSIFFLRSTASRLPLTVKIRVIAGETNLPFHLTSGPICGSSWLFMKISASSEDTSLEVLIPVDQSWVHRVSLPLLRKKSVFELLSVCSIEFPLVYGEKWGVGVAFQVLLLHLEDSGEKYLILLGGHSSIT